jgi:hypothetical protein
MRSRSQKYAEAVDRNTRNMDVARYRAIPLDKACRMLGIRKDDIGAQYGVAQKLSRG